ncbi:MAG: hypothetical protein AAF702_03540 [Chloroflexota bacterium]
MQAQLSRGIALGAHVGVEADLAVGLYSRFSALERVRFANSGTEATLYDIRLARGFNYKSTFLVKALIEQVLPAS